MRKILWIILCLAFMGCRTSQHIALLPNIPPPDTTILPSFPAEACMS
jgi:hypothetical protein